MIGALYKREMKAGYKLLLIFASVLSLYVCVIITMYDPKLGDTLAAFSKSMPELFAAFGMSDSGGSLLHFMTNYLYGFLLVGLPIVFIILLASRLMAKYIDRGSMAYLLASPHKRLSIALTQAASMLTFLFLLAFFVTGLGLVLVGFMFPGELDIKNYIILNICWFGLLCFLSGLCFCTACIFTETKLSLGIGGGLCVLFMLIQMVAQAGEKFEFLKYATPLTLFVPKEIASGNTAYALLCIALFAGGLLFYSIGAAVFARRDLSI